MTTEERIVARIKELVKYRAHLQVELAKCDGVLGELQALLEPEQKEEQKEEE